MNINIDYQELHEHHEHEHHEHGKRTDMDNDTELINYTDCRTVRQLVLWCRNENLTMPEPAFFGLDAGMPMLLLVRCPCPAMERQHVVFIKGHQMSKVKSTHGGLQESSSNLFLLVRLLP
jgi:hypothetical protein